MMARWKEQIDLYEPLHNDALPFRERRDTIVARIRASRWFDEVWNGIYDLADSDRVWLNAFAPHSKETTS